MVVTVHWRAAEGVGRGAADLKRIVPGISATVAGPRGAEGDEDRPANVEIGGGELKVTSRDGRAATRGHANGSPAICGGFTKEYAEGAQFQWQQQQGC